MEATHKRSAQQAGLEDAGPGKASRVEDMLEELDLAVRIKLRSMLDEGMVTPSDLDERNVEALKPFDASTALELLDQFCSCDMSSVRNRGAFLGGILSRNRGRAKPQMAREVAERLDALFAGGGVRPSDLDARCMGEIAAAPPAAALAALDAYAAKDLSAVRSHSALMVSLLRSAVARSDPDHHHPHHGANGTRGGGARDDFFAGGGQQHRYGDGAPRSYVSGSQPPPPPPRRPQYTAPPPAYSSQTAAVQGYAPPPVQPQQPMYATAAPAYASAPQQPMYATAAPAQQPVYAPAAPLYPTAQAPTYAPAPAYGAAPAPAPAGYAPDPYAAQQQHAAYAHQQTYAPGHGYSAAQPAPTHAHHAPYVAPPQTLQPPAQQQEHQYHHQQPGAYPAPAPSFDASGRRYWGGEQAALGVRVSEFHALSPFAAYVHADAAVRLQQLWDNGNELVSLLDDKAWEILADLNPESARRLVDTVADKLAVPGSVRNVNAYWMSVAKKLRDNGSGSHASYSAAPGAFTSRDHGSGSSSALPATRPGGGGGGPSQRRGLHLMSPAVRDKAEELLVQHAPALRPEHFDEAVAETLGRLGDASAVAVLVELASNDLRNVRNVPAYMMGIAKRYAGMPATH